MVEKGGFQEPDLASSRVLARVRKGAIRVRKGANRRNLYSGILRKFQGKVTFLTLSVLSDISEIFMSFRYFPLTKLFPADLDISR